MCRSRVSRAIPPVMRSANRMNKIITLIIAIGLVIALIVFGYTAGYKIGSAIGNDITQQAIENDALTN